MRSQTICRPSPVCHESRIDEWNASQMDSCIACCQFYHRTTYTMSLFCRRDKSRERQTRTSAVLCHASIKHRQSDSDTPTPRRYGLYFEATIGATPGIFISGGRRSIPQWSPGAQLWMGLTDFDCKNDQNLKTLHHPPPDSWPVCLIHCGVRRHFLGLAPLAYAWSCHWWQLWLQHHAFVPKVDDLLWICCTMCCTMCCTTNP